jgi:hypothetical protein
VSLSQEICQAAFNDIVPSEALHFLHSVETVLAQLHEYSFRIREPIYEAWACSIRRVKDKSSLSQLTLTFILPDHVKIQHPADASQPLPISAIHDSMRYIHTELVRPLSMRQGLDRFFVKFMHYLCDPKLQRCHPYVDYIPGTRDNIRNMA